jgi:hypothetical protein
MIKKKRNFRLLKPFQTIFQQKFLVRIDFHGTFLPIKRLRVLKKMLSNLSISVGSVHFGRKKHIPNFEIRPRYLQNIELKFSKL